MDECCWNISTPLKDWGHSAVEVSSSSLLITKYGGSPAPTMGRNLDTNFDVTLLFQSTKNTGYKTCKPNVLFKRILKLGEPFLIEFVDPHKEHFDCGYILKRNQSKAMKFIASH